MDWLTASELRVGLGCMRLLVDESEALATIGAAYDAGITVFDTARAYDGGEALLARALRGRASRIVTKGGMARPDGAWVPDGRARSIRGDCEASLEALDGLPIDLYLLHAPDPRTPLRTSVRALAKLAEERLVARVGVCNVNRAQLEEAVAHAPVSAVQVGLSLLDDRALRGGVVERCGDLGIAVIAHSPLGGPRRVARLSRNEALAKISAAHDASPAEAALAWVLGVAPDVVAIPGARSPEAARSAARAASLLLSKAEHERLRPKTARPTRAAAGDVVLVMGIPGAGKSRVAADYVTRGYARLNRDERGGTLRDVADALDDTLAAGARKVVLDNTYLTRASRSYVVEAAARHGVAVRCTWLHTPPAHAQVNLVERLLERFGDLPGADELKRAARTEPGVLTPTQQMRAIRELEEPGDEEGFASIERVTFERAPREGRRPGAFVAASAVERLPLDGIEPDVPMLVFDWLPDGAPSDLGALAALLPGKVEISVCPHGGGPPVCWCRPPLPGLPLAFAHRHGIDPARSTLHGTSAAHRTLAAALGARFVGPDGGTPLPHP